MHPCLLPCRTPHASPLPSSARCTAAAHWSHAKDRSHEDGAGPPAGGGDSDDAHDGPGLGKAPDADRRGDGDSGDAPNPARLP